MWKTHTLFSIMALLSSPRSKVVAAEVKDSVPKIILQKIKKSLFMAIFMEF